MKILLPVDGSTCSTAALAFVATRPPVNGRRPQVDLLNVQLPIPPRAGRALDADLVSAWHEAAARKVLKPAAAVLQAAHLDPAWFHRVGHPGAVIAQWAEDHGSDLIVMGSHGRTALSNLIFGSVTQTVLASTHVPLLVLRSPRVPKRISLRVGIALDGSDCSLAAVRFVVGQLGFFGPRARYTLLHVVEPDELRSPPAADQGVPRPDCEHIVAPARELFAGAKREVAVECHAGRPGVEIAQAARSGFDLLVMGSHGRGALTSAVLGSVAWRVAAGCDTPLLLVRAPG